MTILKFYADWCIPCKTLTTVLDTLDVKTENINIELDPKAAIKHSVRKVPTLIFLDDEGNVTGRLHGVPNGEEIKEKIDEAQGNTKVEQKA